MSEQLKSSFSKLKAGKPLDDNELQIMKDAIEKALPFLDNYHGADCVRFCALLDLSTINEFQRTRKLYEED